ncbi:hypothetical protein JTB14_036385 [Gonioctena quinquepunctata]|nr:hypothetical protein JTB14_036385 [Gonioctena quinquepunctata]
MDDYEKYIPRLQALLDEVDLEEEQIGGEVEDDGGDNVSDSEHDTNSEQSDDDDVAVEDNTVAVKVERSKKRWNLRTMTVLSKVITIILPMVFLCFTD